MQTFLPVVSFVESMEFLDNARLGKQRVETCQILEVLTNVPILPKNLQSIVTFERTHGAWSKHPAVLMWRNHEEWLKLYLACAVGEWVFRGFRNTITVPGYDTSIQGPPEWLGDDKFHSSHRSNLVRKMPHHYKKFWPNQDDSLPYFWPTKEVTSVQDL